MNTRPTNHRQLSRFKLLILLLALVALAAVLSWVMTRGGGPDRLRALLGGPTATPTLPVLTAVQRVALTATAEAQATEAVVAAQTAEVAAAATQATATAGAQATATAEAGPAATETMVAIALATQTAKAVRAAEEATPTPAPTETPTPTPTGAAPAEAAVEVTPTPAEAPAEAATPELAATPTPPQEFQYTVRWGDTLTGLARRFGTTVDDIIQRNNLVDPDLIRVGQTLAIFGTPPAPPVDYVVRPGDTLWAIAIRFNTTVGTIAQLNRIANPDRIWAGQTLRIVPGALVAPPDYRTYTVRRGDTLWAIALRHGTTPWAVAIVNNLPNPHLIFPGQVLRIP